ncbi:MAG: ribonuclease HI [Selenomonadaceae bacterium]|nr:ribonuclease HI [Selenomonadaceae bacterium]
MNHLGGFLMIKIYTDGSCLGNPGAGGWAVVIVDEQNHREEIFGGEVNTTNNRMELTAAIRALEKISAGDRVELFTDSSYLKNAFTNGWLAKWKRNGWKTANKKPVLNKDLWLELDELISSRAVNFNWVKGHAGHFFNERCDELARGAAARIKVVPKILPPVKSAPRIEKIPKSTPVKPKKISVPEENLPRGQLSLF